MLSAKSPAILLSDAISIEIFPSFQIATAGDSNKHVIATAGDSNKHVMFHRLCKGAFTLAIFARDFALSLHILLPKIFFFISKHASLVRNRASVNATLIPLKSMRVHHFVNRQGSFTRESDFALVSP